MVLKSKFILMIVFGTSSGCSKKKFFLVHLQVLARFYCQSLRRYQKKPKKIQKLKRYQKKSFSYLQACGLPRHVFFVFLVPPHVLAFFVFYFCTSSGFGTMLLPKPEEVPKKPKNIAKT